ncbi:hypothetical protein ACPOL_4816 [Acidisarcina polymorpha]|uniref:Uncharacterized protein n=1 Tax=Acidisarcina polymorpha TaxID=2211140 RepID=A0A2Z5G532_9BACT|nr:hypothetical protein ACPOL_4816 [Acidisarcina polymorpha]
MSLPPKGVWMFKAIYTGGSSKPMPAIQTWSYSDDREDIQKISCEM